jgi:hypothetical protein
VIETASQRHGDSLRKRCSELVSLQVEDFERSAAGEDGLMRVRKSNRTKLAGDLRYVMPLPRHHLERWLAMTLRSSGPLFLLRITPQQQLLGLRRHQAADRKGGIGLTAINAANRRRDAVSGLGASGGGH